MTIHIRELGGVVVISIDPERCDQLLAAVEPYIQSGRRAFVLDGSGLAYLNSLGIAELITCRQRIAALPGRLVLANLNDNVQQIFRVLKLERLFSLGLDLPGAIKAVAG